MNNEDFCSYEIAVKLKELGFDQSCRHYYTKENTSDNDVWLTTATFSPEDWNNGRNAEPDFLKPLCSAPSLWQAQKWLREAHGVHVEPWFVYNGRFDLYIVSENLHLYKHYTNMLWTDYESALSAGIEAALKLKNYEPPISYNPEQGTHLIACGVDPKSADLVWKTVEIDGVQHIALDDVDELTNLHPIPAWTLPTLLAFLPYGDGQEIRFVYHPFTDDSVK